MLLKDCIPSLEARYLCRTYYIPPLLCKGGIFQIPSDLVVKSQATDIIDLILQLIGHPNGVHRSCCHRKSRGAVLSISEVQWATTKFDGVWHFLRQQDGVPMAHDAHGYRQWAYDLWLLQTLASRWGLGTGDGDAAPGGTPEPRTAARTVRVLCG